MSAPTIDPTAAQLAAFAASHAGRGAVTMLNLLRYRDHADYATHPDATPCSGREAYARYAAEAMACVAAAGGRVVFAGAAEHAVIGPPGEHWDDVLLVEYPSAQALLDMLATPRYRACVHHRSAALADSRLLPLAAGRCHFQA